MFDHFNKKRINPTQHEKKLLRVIGFLMFISFILFGVVMQTKGERDEVVQVNSQLKTSLEGRDKSESVCSKLMKELRKK